MRPRRSRPHRLAYRAAIRWADEHTTATARAWSIEGAASFGAGLAMTLAAADEFIIEFDHPTTPASKDGAKSDALDAIRAAREILGRSTWSTPRSRGTREGLRALIVARDGARTARTATINTVKSLVLTAPIDLREQLRGLTLTALLHRCTRLRPDTATDPELAAKLALRSTATRALQLTDEANALETAMRPPVVDLAPRLLNEPGIGTLLAAQIIVSWSHPRWSWS